jgi:CheY-like chemotaxis protein
MTETLLSPKRVLVVDDNRDAAITIGLLLEAAGYEVETCFDGDAALEAARRFGPDACVLDINLPGMEGYELAQRLREKLPGRPMVIATLTAYNDYAHLKRAADAGFDLQFTKPADAFDLEEQLRDCLGSKSE